MEDKDVKYDSDPNTKLNLVCCLCECPPGLHAMCWKCPLFQGELICQECCQLDTLRSDIDKRFSEKLGTPITKEEINAKCKECGRNNAAQNDALARNLEQGKVDSHG